MKNKVFHIAVVGGPCGGKTTVLARLSRRLPEKGFHVLIAPEAATPCINGGLSPVDGKIGVEMGQRAIINLQYHIEGIWRIAAEKLSERSPVVVLYDRGITDSSAYCPPELYRKLLKELGENPVHVRDRRYDGVIHLVTAADGAEKFYSSASNAARYESPRKAQMRDRMIKRAWTPHPHFRVVDNSTNFKKKMRRVVKEVFRILGMPPVEHERKFLVSFRRTGLPFGAARVDIEQFYPKPADPKTTLRFRKRGQKGSYTYYRTTKEPCGHGKNIELEGFVSESEYLANLRRKRRDTAVVRKTRICFLHRNQYLELDVFKDKGAIPTDGMLEIELTDRTQSIAFPRWLKVEKEVTGDPRYSNLGIAQALAKKD